MKKIISRILIIFIIILIVFEFSFSSTVSLAAGISTEDINRITNLIGGVVSIILWIPRILITGIAWIFDRIMTEELAESCGINNYSVFAGTENQTATPFDIFFNKYKLFDVNFFDITNEDNVINDIRNNVANWFYIMRTISAAILLCILIYVGIRMAISTVADDKAKYKKMLFDWCCSLALIFVLQYIAIFTIYANDAIVGFLRDLDYKSIDSALNTIIKQAMLGMGINSIVATFIYCMIVFQTIAFMITYMSRVLKVGFLIIISPLISITYSIDKMGDGKAQALNTWLKEFVYTILIQPFHCIMYLAFVNTAIGLLDTAPVGPIKNITNLFNGDFNQLANGFLVILCLKFINDGEQAIRKIFNFQDDSSMTSMAAGAALGMAAIANAKKIGKTTAKIGNTAKSLPTRLRNAKAKDKDKGLGGKLSDTLKNSNLGKGVSKLGEKAGKLSSKKNSGVGKKASALGKKAGELGNRVGERVSNSRTIQGAKR